MSSDKKSSREEYFKNYMKAYIHDEKKGGQMEHCQACDCKYKKYNRHHHTSTAKHKRNIENIKLKNVDVARLEKLENQVSRLQSLLRQ